MVEPISIGQALQIGRKKIPPLDARLLLEAVVNRPVEWLIAHNKSTLSSDQWAAYEAYLDRALAGEPIPYITGKTWFFGRPFIVSPAVLIPRPETEKLVEKALAAAQSFDNLHIVDVGTGSGCIAITLGCEPVPRGAIITAVDHSTAALAVARQNWRHLAPTNPQVRINFGQSDLLEEVAGPIHLLVANLPYITDSEFADLDPSVRDFEPAIALRGGKDGLDLINALLHQATDRMAPGGVLLLEIGWQQRSAALHSAHLFFPDAAATCHQDLAGRDRILEIKLQ